MGTRQTGKGNDEDTVVEVRIQMKFAPKGSAKKIIVPDSAESPALPVQSNDTLIKAQRPKAGWLTAVYDKANRIFQEGVQARYWAGVVSQSGDAAEIWTAYLLLLDTIDNRLIIDPPAFDVPTKSWKASWLDFLQEHRANARSDNHKAWKDSHLLSEAVNNIVYVD